MSSTPQGSEEGRGDSSSRGHSGLAETEGTPAQTSTRLSSAERPEASTSQVSRASVSSTASTGAGRWRKWLKRSVYFALIMSLLSGLLIAGVWWYFGRDLPDFKSLNDYTPPQLTRVLDRRGAYLGRLSKVRRTVIPFSEISPVMVHALLSAEDADFYQHQGLDYWGILRAVYNSVRAGRLKGSGSTITQQTVKNILLTHEKTLARKLKEIILTKRIEGRFSKDDILSMYLNTIYFGHGRYGIEEASRYYFNVHAAELSLTQAATLAGIIQSPERHSPRKHPRSALRRRAYVLREMYQNQYISEAEHQEALKSELGLSEKRERGPMSAQWWVAMVRDQVKKRYSGEALSVGGLTIKSTLDLRVQEAAQKAVQLGLRELDQRQKLDRPRRTLNASQRAAWLKRAREQRDGAPPKMNVRLKGLVTEVKGEGQDRAVTLSFGVGLARLHKTSIERLARAPQVGDVYDVYLSYDGPRHPQVMRAHLNLPQAAFVALDPHTREVLAVVGGYSFYESAYNRAKQAHRQPGSAFKPFVYGAALESRRFTLSTILLDTPETISLGGGRRWTPKNYNGKFVGPVPFGDALARSINSVAVRLADSVGIERVQGFAQRAGLREVKLTDSLTLALGSSEITLFELVNAYATFAADGGYAEPILIQGVTVNPMSVLTGHKSDLAWPTPPAPERVISDDVAWLIQRMLRGVVTRGSGRRLLRYKGDVIGKTGTSNEGKDAWFVGSLPNITFGAWVGYDAPQSLGRKEAGGRSAAPIILSFLKESGWRAGAWRDKPEGIERASIDPKSGLLARPDQEGAVEGYFLRGSAPTEVAPSAREGKGVSQDSILFGGGL